MLTKCLAQVGTEHIFLGMVAEEREKPGLFGPAITLKATEDVLLRIASHGRQASQSSSAESIPFTLNAQQLFKAALQVCVRPLYPVR
jgi:hypothetical protein